jgi:hypothetical protein
MKRGNAASCCLLGARAAAGQRCRWTCLGGARRAFPGLRRSPRPPRPTPTPAAGGQKVKLVLAAAMWNNPQLLVLDEPTNYLDRESLGERSAACPRPPACWPTAGLPPTTLRLACCRGPAGYRRRHPAPAQAAPTAGRPGAATVDAHCTGA